MAEREASNQKTVDQFRRDMEVWKDQAHATKVAQEMAMREWNRFGKTAARLESEAWKLGEDMRRLMKSGNEMSAQELKDLQRLLRKTAKTVKSTSYRDCPKSPPAPPPPPPPPLPPPPPEPPQGQEQAPAPEPPQGQEQAPPPEPPQDQELAQVPQPLAPPGPKPRGERSRGSPSDSSSPSSSSDSDDSSAAGTLESRLVLRNRRKARMSKRKGFLVMQDLGDVQQSQKKKKLQFPKPDAYDGSIDANPTYQ